MTAVGSRESARDPRFLAARREWSDRYADLARGKRNWQIAALGLLLANLGLAAGLSWLSTQSRVTPFVVEVDRLGQAVAFGPAERLRKTDERLVRYQLGLFLHDVRTVVGDADAQREILSRAYAYARGAAVASLNRHFTDQNPFARARRERARVVVESILPLSEETWQVRWEETTLSPGGRETGRKSWQAVVTVEVDPPETTEALLVNPLGLYVTEIHWTPTL